MAYAKIVLELFRSGIRFSCEDCEYETFIPKGNGDMLIEELNHVDEICDPDSRFMITEKGKEHLAKLKKELNDNV